jgi:hypothetical protein
MHPNNINRDGGFNLREAQVDVPLSLSHSCV